jgi:hypothetical protein
VAQPPQPAVPVHVPFALPAVFSYVPVAVVPLIVPLAVVAFFVVIVTVVAVAVPVRVSALPLLSIAVPDSTLPRPRR